MNPQTYTAPQEQQEAPASFAAILPLLLFLLIFIGTGVSLSLAGVDMAFYQLSATVAILPAIALALMQGRARLSKKITIFLTGVGEINIITMCMIYLLAGGFATTATAIGSVDATVNFGLSLVPPAFILPGLFLIGAFVSTAMGTSMGTVARPAPLHTPATAWEKASRQKNRAQMWALSTPKAMAAWESQKAPMKAGEKT